MHLFGLVTLGICAAKLGEGRQNGQDCGRGHANRNLSTKIVKAASSWKRVLPATGQIWRASRVEVGPMELAGGSFLRSDSRQAISQLMTISSYREAIMPGGYFDSRSHAARSRQGRWGALPEVTALALATVR